MIYFEAEALRTLCLRSRCLVYCKETSYAFEIVFALTFERIDLFSLFVYIVAYTWALLSLACTTRCERVLLGPIECDSIEALVCVWRACVVCVNFRGDVHSRRLEGIVHTFLVCRLVHFFFFFKVLNPLLIIMAKYDMYKVSLIL